MEAIISFAGIGINYKKLQSKLQHDFGRVLKALTVTARALPGQPKHIAIRQETAFTLQGEYIYFPILLQKQFEMFNMVYTTRPVSLRALPCVETEFPLFNYQQEMVDKIHKKLLSPLWALLPTSKYRFGENAYCDQHYSKTFVPYPGHRAHQGDSNTVDRRANIAPAPPTCSCLQ